MGHACNHDTKVNHFSPIVMIDVSTPEKCNPTNGQQPGGSGQSPVVKETADTVSTPRSGLGSVSCGQSGITIDREVEASSSRRQVPARHCKGRWQHNKM